MTKAYSVLNKYKKILISVSGGSDSDIMIDIFERIREPNHDIVYVWFDTGIEYQATKDHLEYLQDKYSINIVQIKAKVPSPLTCKLYGQPFLSKFISQFIEGLQRHGFSWTDESFDVLYKRYPKIKSYLKWWCNLNGKDTNSDTFNIRKNKYLKEFMIANPPRFRISSKCCKYSKKDTAKHVDVMYSPDVKAIGVRKAEGGIRATSYKTCFSTSVKTSQYRPLFFWTDKDKQEYKDYYGITYSDCYEIYGMTRTGCAGCPYNSKFEETLNIIDTYEPKLSNAVRNIFKDSYEYTRAYREFKKQYKERERK